MNTHQLLKNRRCFTGEAVPVKKGVQHSTGRRFSRLLESLFFGNYFYGLCAVALSLEALLQQGMFISGLSFFPLVFFATVLYYTHPYVRRCSYLTGNPRTNWYSRNFTLVCLTQTVITTGLITYFASFILAHKNAMKSIAPENWALLLVFPLSAAWYYGNDRWMKRSNLRSKGGIKPFVIGFIWAGVVTIYPVFYYSIINGVAFHLSRQGFLLFIKNMMFISVLCVMFDFKDFLPDYSGRLHTFVVRIGLRKTLAYVLIPLTLAGMGSFLAYAMVNGFSTGKISLNILPFIGLLLVIRSFRKRRPLLYYLFVVDGLMIVKALCGIIAIHWF